MTAPDSRPEPGPDAGVGDIEKDIEATRKELGDTVEALSAKLDVKQQAKDKVEETKYRIATSADSARHAATDNPKKSVPIAAIVVLAVVAVVVWRRRR